MRIFVVFEDVRLPLDVQPRQTVGDVKSALRDHFKLNSSHVEDKILQLTYAGAVLRDNWVCSDIGLTSGATVKSCLKDSDKPVIHVELFNGDVIYIREQIDPGKTLVSELRNLVASQSGLPVSAFRLLATDGKEMFDTYYLKAYGIKLGSTIQLHVWDGWNQFLNAALHGHTRKVFRHVALDEQVAKFQFRVACHVAAHFGHVDLANSMINPKMGLVKPDEPVGVHPSKLWCKASAHVDAWKCPVHEAAERGNLNVLRIFVQNNICCLVAEDGRGHTPIQVSFKYSQAECLSYLTSKLYSSYTENSITLAVVVVIKARKWCERAKENVLVKYGAFSSSLKRRPYKPAATVGFGVNVDGFGESVMTSRSKVAENNHPLQIANWKIPEFKSRRPITELISLTTRNSSQNAVGSALTKKTSAKSYEKTLPDLSKQSRHKEFNLDDDATDSGSYIRTPKQKRRRLPSIDEDKPTRSRHANVIEGALSLPAVSSENTLRPFFHVSSRVVNPVQSALKMFDKYRHLPSRDNAIQCMIIAGTFKDKVWLRQVDLAISLAKRNVHNSLRRNDRRGNGLHSRTVPTVASCPIKLR